MKTTCRLPVLGPAIAAGVIALVLWMIWNKRDNTPLPEDEPATLTLPPPPPSHKPPPPPRLLEGYADPATPPIEDLKKIRRVITGYFTVVKDTSRFPIGGNADLSAALRGENPNRETYLPEGHPVFSEDGLLIDRWKSALVVHPEAWGQIELRSPGPDKISYTEDDLVLTPDGVER